MSSVPLIAASVAALVVISAATFLCSLRRRRRQSPSQRSDALGYDVELGGRGIDEAVLAAYPTLAFSSAPPVPPQQRDGEESRDKEKRAVEKETDEEEEQAEETGKATTTVQVVPAGDTAARCAVCQADYADGDELRLLPDCGHAFHRRCIDQWLRRRPTCPVCRASPPPPRSG